MFIWLCLTHSQAHCIAVAEDIDGVCASLLFSYAEAVVERRRVRDFSSFEEKTNEKNQLRLPHI